MSTNKHANRLIHEKSPYLLQHAHNPVNWYPWDKRAFTKAKNEDKPILLSSGYSTCHWCHVMAHESFENEEVAKILNENFVAIKVDREERPDIDHIYMTFCQALTGSGGWPLTVFMTPEQKPFYAGTYFPLYSKYNYPGFIELLAKVSELWKRDRQTLVVRSEDFVISIKNMTPKRKIGDLPHQAITEAVSLFGKSFDPRHGGFSRSPKFPMPHVLQFLMNYALTSNRKALSLVDKTLDSMYRGGIYDHIGGGFSRYSTDRLWLVPHFEKMLYDNALLIPIFVKMGIITDKAVYKSVAVETLDYLMRDMESPEGAFYTAEDADSEGIEGLFYVFSPDEISNILPENEARLFIKHFGITEKGNFEGKSIPNLLSQKTLPEPDTEIAELISELKIRVRRARAKRVRPHRDEKILTGWNGLLIAALARAGRGLNRPDYYAKAEKCYQFIKKHLTSETGRLYGSYCDGQIGSLGILDDYSFLTYGLLELFQATGKAYLLEDARHLVESMFMLFGDDQEGGFYFYGNDSEELVLRPKESYDGALPSGNAIAVHNLLTLSRLKKEPYYQDVAEKALKTFAKEIELSPKSHAAWLDAMLQINSKPTAVIASVSAADAVPLEQVVDNNYYPFITVIRYKGDMELARELPFLEDYTIGATPTAYVCTEKQCYAPITEPSALKDLLDKLYFAG